MTGYLPSRYDVRFSHRPNQKTQVACHVWLVHGYTAHLAPPAMSTQQKKMRAYENKYG